MLKHTKRPSIKRFKHYYYAHRGLYDNETQAPENSPRAFALAVNKGYGIELDVRLTRDFVPVVFHDESLSRICGRKGRVEDYTYRELSTFFLLKSVERIPRLTEVLSYVRGRVPLIVEIKSADGRTKVCKYVCALLKDYKGPCCVESFHPFVLLWMRRHMPDMIRGQLIKNDTKSRDKGILWLFAEHLLFILLGRPDFIAYDCDYANTPSQRFCKWLYRRCSAAWTVTSQKQLDQLKRSYDLFIFEDFEPKQL